MKKETYGIVDADEFQKIKEEVSRSAHLFGLLEEAPSFNPDPAIKRGTRLLIVGTISPAGSKGYFYTSSYSRMYGVLDFLLPDARFVEKKDNSKLLKTTLEQYDIAFLDVFSQVIRKKGSSSDDAIICGQLDYDRFMEAIGLLSEDAMIIAVSKRSLFFLEKILKANGHERFLNRVVRCSIFTNKTVDAIAKEWNRAFDERGFALTGK